MRFYATMSLRSMIYGVGIDIVELSRVERMYKRWGKRFLNRIFTPIEVERCLKRKRPWLELAARIAAKEAFAKAVGLGWRQGLHWKLVEVVNLPSGQPVLNLYGKAAAICKNHALNSFVSLTHDGNYAAAVVVLSKEVNR